MIYLLLSSGFSDAAVVLRTGHRYKSSLKSYNNLRGKYGEDQLAAVFGGTDSDLTQPEYKKMNLQPSNTAVDIGGIFGGTVNANNCTLNITIQHR